MPKCPQCGDEFPRGGAYTSHVRFCDDEPRTENEQIRALEARLERVEKLVPRMKNTVTYAQVEEIAEMAVSQEVQPIKAEIPHLQGRIDKLESELETVRINCADCDAVISAPWLKPSECPDCGMGLNWSAFEEAEVQ